MSQKAYSLEALRLAEMQACSPLPIPLVPSQILLREEEQTLYRSLVGRSNWLAVETRQGLKLTVMKLQHRTATLTKNNMEAVHAAYRYLKSTTERWVELGKMHPMETGMIRSLHKAQFDFLLAHPYYDIPRSGRLLHRRRQQRSGVHWIG
ncbi:hypothetical protein N7519_011069 [Penicillium mononematosum]|uniref:uncharacterized protein n=1 Tax=Penicillium mononematosum TaxID=268346 RepID=UPI002548557C|nr:uncharacterized protein N7519_011069 [Penicillium mononematosum]KAJ6180608.1 hypothetical protein N7519_011069 [Penicillium mononematosum]